MRIAAIGLLASSLCLSVTQGFAADMPTKAPFAAPAAVPAWSWTGFYLGVHAGYGGDKFDYDFANAVVPITATVRSSGGFGGVQGGYNWQLSNWLLGLEADIAWADIENTISVSGPGISASAGSELKWFGTVRGRVGYAWERLLIYATGGWAYGEVRTNLSFGSPGAIGGIGLPGAVSFTETHRKSGWTGGGGFEYMVTPQLSLKTEYLYLDLGRDTIFTAPGLTVTEGTTVHTLKAGLNFKFWRM